MQLRMICLAVVLILLSITVTAQDMSQYGVKKGLKMSGGLNFNSTAYTSSGIPNRRDPFSWFLSGNVNINAFGYNMPFSFALSNASHNYTQPFNRIQFKPYWKWIKAYWGSTSMNFSPLTLAGHVFNGYGVEMTRNKWQFAAMYGKLKEKVEYNPIIKNAGSVAFKRKGWGFKGSYRFKGGDDVSFIFFTAKDDSSSLVFVPIEANITPKENYVASISFKKKVLKKFNVQFEYAVSGIISDKTAAAKPTGSSKTFLGKLLPQKNNAVFYDAVKAAFGYNARKYSIQLQYERITPEYQTLGAYFFNNDLRNITIAPTIRLFKGKVNLGGNIGVQRNNLDKTKNSTTKRFVGSGNISWSKSEKWNFNGTYNNFSTYTNVKPQADPFLPANPLDTLNFYQVNSSMSLAATHSFGSKNVKKNLSLNATYQRASDEQAGTQLGSRQSNFISGNLAYSQNMPKKNINLSGAINLNLSNAPGAKTVFFGPNINIGTSLFKKLVKVNGGGTYNKNISNGQSNSSVWNARMSFSYAPKAKKETPANKTLTKEETTGSKKNDPIAIGLKKSVEIKNPLKGRQNMSMNIMYMNKLPVALQRQGLSELTITFNWGYSF